MAQWATQRVIDTRGVVLLEQGIYQQYSSDGIVVTGEQYVTKSIGEVEGLGASECRQC